MPVVQDAHLDTIPLFAVDVACLAPDVIRDAGGRHQIAFVAGVDEHSASIRLATEHGDRDDPAVLFLDAAGAVEPSVAMDGDLLLGDEIFKDLLGRVWLEDPHRPLVSVDGRRALAAIAVFGSLLPFPGVIVLIVPPDAVIELPGQTADDLLAAGVGPAEPAGRQTAQMRVGADQDHRLAHFGHLHRRRHPGRGAPIDDHVRLVRLRRRSGRNPHHQHHQQD